MTVAERIAQIRADLKIIAADLAVTDDIKASIMFLSACEMVADAHGQAEHLEDQEWEGFADRQKDGPTS